MKKGVREILICIAVLSVLLCLFGCQSEENPDAGKIFFENEEKERLSHFPKAPERPDENGCFPEIERSLVENYILNKKGKTDEKKPDNLSSDPFNKESVQEFLSLCYPEIKKWDLKLSHGDYSMSKDTYDPFTYSIRDMYVPSYLLILDTDEGEDFDRLVISFFESCALLNDGENCIPKSQTSFSVYTSNKKDWGNLSSENNEIILSDMYYSGIWFKDENKAAVFPGAGEEVLFLNDVREEPPQVFSASNIVYYIPSYEGNFDDMFVLTNKPSGKDDGIFFYDGEKKTLTEFEDMEKFSVIPLEKSSFVSMGNENILIYDLASDDPCKSIKIDDSVLSGSSIKRAALTKDRNDPSMCAAAYKDGEGSWYAAVFDKDGNIMSNYELDIKMQDLYEYEFNFVDNIIYIDNRILDDNFRFASNASSDKDHRTMLVQIERAETKDSLFIKPLYYPILMGKEFKDPQEITCYPEIAERIFDMLEDDKTRTFWDEFPGGRISSDGMMEYIKLFFDVDKETVKANSKSYTDENGTVVYKPRKDIMPLNIHLSGGPYWDGGEGFVILTLEDGCETEYKVSIKKSEEAPFGFKFTSLEKYTK